MKSNKKFDVLKLVQAGMFLSIAFILPAFTGQIPNIGKSLCPMHIPVLLCGFICGPWYALIIGIIAPILRFMLFGMPVIVPTGIIMSMELATYGFVCGMLYKILPKKIISVYVSLIGAMIAGRIVWGIMHVVFLNLGQYDFGFDIFITGAFVSAIPGIIIQIVFIPLLVIKLDKLYKHT